MWKHPHLKPVGETETQSHHIHHPSMATHNQKGAHNSKLPPEGWRIWIPILTPQLLRSAPEWPAHKTSSFESQWDLHPQDPQGYSGLRKFLNGACVHTMAPPQSPVQKQQTSTPSLLACARIINNNNHFVFYISQTYAPLLMTKKLD